MGFQPEENLTDAEIQTGLQYIIGDGIASQTMGALTGGAFLIAFAVKPGASNLVMGLLAFSVEEVKQMISFPITVVRNVTERIILNAKQ